MGTLWQLRRADFVGGLVCGVGVGRATGSMPGSHCRRSMRRGTIVTGLTATRGGGDVRHGMCLEEDWIRSGGLSRSGRGHHCRNRGTHDTHGQREIITALERVELRAR